MVIQEKSKSRLESHRHCGQQPKDEQQPNHPHCHLERYISHLRSGATDFDCINLNSRTGTMTKEEEEQQQQLQQDDRFTRKSPPPTGHGHVHDSPVAHAHNSLVETATESRTRRRSSSRSRRRQSSKTRRQSSGGGNSSKQATTTTTTVGNEEDPKKERHHHHHHQTQQKHLPGRRIPEIKHSKTNYYDTKNNSGPMTPGISSRMLLSSNNNSSDDGSATCNDGVVVDDDDDNDNNEMVSIGSRGSTQHRKWTRSLSPRRTATDLHDSFREKVISPAVNSLRKLKTRTRAWSQSPVASRGSSQNQQTHLTAGRNNNNNQNIADALSISPPLTNDNSSNDDDDAMLRDTSDAVALALAAAKNRHRRNDFEQSTSLSSESLVVPSRLEDDDPTRPRSRSSRGIQRSKSDSHKQRLKQSKIPKPNQSSASSKKTDSATSERRPDRDKRPSSSPQSSRSRRQDHRQRHLRSGKREAQSKRSSKNSPTRFASSTDGVVEASSNLKQQMLNDKMNRSHNDIDYLRQEAMMSTTAENKSLTKEEEEKGEDSDNESSLYEVDSSDSSIDNPPPSKPASDPGKLTSLARRATTTTTTSNIRSKLPPSSMDPSSLSSHNVEKPSSDPGLFKSSGTSRTKMIVDRTPHQPKTLPAGGRRNLDKDTLKSVQDVKDSIRQIRMERFAQRDKGKKFDTSKSASVTRPGMSQAAKSKQPSQSPASSKSTITPKSQTSTQLKPAISHSEVGNNSFSSSFRKDDSTKGSSTIEQQKNQQQLLFNTSSTRLGEITLDDLDLKAMKTNKPIADASFSSLPVSAPLFPSTTNNNQKSNRDERSDVKAERISQMTKSIRKTKRQIKRTCRDVWTERDEIVHLQRRNWSIRKSLLNMEAPKDSVTTLNLKLERTLQREGEAAVQLDAIRQKKRDLEKDCSNLTQKVSEFTKLLDSLNEQVAPLLPTVHDIDSVEEYNKVQPGGPGAESPLTVGDRIAVDSRNRAAALVASLLDPDEFSDSINSTEDEIHRPQQPDTEERELEPSLSLRHLRLH